MSLTSNLNDVASPRSLNPETRIPTADVNRNPDPNAAREVTWNVWRRLAPHAKEADQCYCGGLRATGPEPHGSRASFVQFRPAVADEEGAP